MPATRNGQGNPSDNTNTPSTNIGSGAWQQSSSGAWTWNPIGTPDPSLVSQWGYSTITNNTQSPAGVENTGSWVPQHGGGWDWLWGDNVPDPNLVRSYGLAQLTDPNHLPGNGNPTTSNSPTPNDVNTPSLNDTWNGTPPIVNGTLSPTPTSGSTVSSPPPVSAYVVAPGDIRNAESVVLASTDGLITDYNSLQSQVNAAKTENVYTQTAGSLIDDQDQALLNVGDALELAGQFINALNNAAQNYALADMNSFLPQS